MNIVSSRTLKIKIAFLTFFFLLLSNMKVILITDEYGCSKGPSCYYQFLLFLMLTIYTFNPHSIDFFLDNSYLMIFIFFLVWECSFLYFSILLQSELTIE